MRGDVRAHKRNRVWRVVDTFTPPVPVVKRPRARGRNPWLDRVRAEYGALLEAWESDCEAVTKGHSEEIRDYMRDHPKPTFRQVLKDSRSQTEDEVVA